MNAFIKKNGELKPLKKLFFGTAGIPLSSVPHTTVSGIKRVKELGLGSMELEFVHSVNVNSSLAVEVKKTAEKNQVVLTCHAPYYVNLASKENAKIKASKARILSSARRASECGAFSVCFHAGFYQGRPAKEIYSVIKNELREIEETLKGEGINIWLRPETTGKQTQFGSLEEIISLSSELSRVMPCVDFSHLHARTAGEMNSFSEFSQALELIEKGLGKKALREMHIHVSGIAYGEKGERNHLNLSDSDLKFSELLRALKDFNCKGVLICESPNIEVDALLLKKTFSEI